MNDLGTIISATPIRVRIYFMLAGFSAALVTVMGISLILEACGILR